MFMWATDLHLNFLRMEGAQKELGKCLSAENPDADGLLISGDISTAIPLVKHITQFAEGFEKPIYYVLGNHDFYNSSFKEVNRKLLELNVSNLYWLQQTSPIKLHDFDVVGVTGWYDAYYGNTNEMISMNDFYCIAELMQGVSVPDLLIRLLREEASKQADILYRQLKATTQDNIIIVTHVPPYKESAFHEGSMSDDEWLPGMSSATIGQTIDRYAENNPSKKITVLCGHTHSPGIYAKKNVTVYTGKAVYGMPDVCGKLDLQNKTIETYNHIERKVVCKL